jgi:predicted nucleic acid-binding protein
MEKIQSFIDTNVLVYSLDISLENRFFSSCFFRNIKTK